MSDIPAAVRKAAASTQDRAPDPDKLQALQKMVVVYRDLEEEKANLEERLKTTNMALQEMQFKTLPDAFDAIGVNVLGVKADGNHPAVEAKALPYYRANIAADWEPERRQAAFQCLHDLGHEDIIKTEITLQFPRGQSEKAQKLLEQLKARGYEPTLKETVPHTTLTAWLKEQVERHNFIPPLDTLGATVGRVVKIKVKE